MKLQNPIYVSGPLEDALTTVGGLLVIDGRFAMLADVAAGTCSLTCRQGCEPQVWKVKFISPETACSDCNRQAGIQIVHDRHPEFDNQTINDVPNFVPFRYPFTPQTGIITAAQIAAWVLAQVNNPFQNGMDYFGITAVLDASDGTNETVIFTMSEGCENFRVENLIDATQNTITEVFAGMNAVLPATWIAQYFPLQQGLAVIPGAPAPENWYGCQNPCFLHLRNCIPYCTGQEIPEFNNRMTESYQDVIVVFDSAVTNFAATNVAALVDACTGLCRFVARGASTGLVAGTVAVVIGGTTTNVTMDVGETKESLLLKVNAAIQPTYPNVNYHLVYSGGAWVVEVSFGISGGVMPPTILSIGGVALVPTEVDGEYCGCLYDTTAFSYPYTGKIRVNPDEYVQITAAANIAAVLTQLQAKVAAAVRFPAASLFIYFPYDAVTSSGAAVVCPVEAIVQL